MAADNEQKEAARAELQRRSALMQLRMREEQFLSACCIDELPTRVPEPETISGEELRAFMANNRPLPEGGGPIVALLRDHCPNAPVDGSFLDIGCGSGELAVMFAAMFPSMKITAVDVSAECIAEARKLAREMSLANMPEFIQARLPDADLGGRRFDTVFSRSALHHFADGKGFWQAVRRHAADDGAICVFDLLRPRSRRIAELYVAGATFEDGPEIQKRIYLKSFLSSYRPHEVKADAEAAGLRNLGIRMTDSMHLVAFRDSAKGNLWLN